MEVSALLIDGFERVGEVVHRIVDGGIDEKALHERPGDGNSVAWLLWHLARVQDAQVAALAGTEQVWLTGGWVRRFGLDLDDADTGYGHSSREVGAVRVDSPALLTGYADAVLAASRAALGSLGPDDLDRVVDDSYDPPVTAGERLVSILADDLQHAGQAAYVAGTLTR